jgi:UDP:flavonoid glycosyltransferase YjiC (YdhE family)
LPGIEACKRSDLVICNGGGTGIVYQAIEGNIPILGIPTNADQYYVINAVESQGGGLSIRSTHISIKKVTKAVKRLLSDEQFKKISVI